MISREMAIGLGVRQNCVEWRHQQNHQALEQMEHLHSASTLTTAATSSVKPAEKINKSANTTQPRHQIPGWTYNDHIPMSLADIPDQSVQRSTSDEQHKLKRWTTQTQPHTWSSFAQSEPGCIANASNSDAADGRFEFQNLNDRPGEVVTEITRRTACYGYIQNASFLSNIQPPHDHHLMSLAHTW